MHTFTTGLIKTESLVLSSTVRMLLSLPGNTLVTIEIGHSPLGILLSLIFSGWPK